MRPSQSASLKSLLRFVSIVRQECGEFVVLTTRDGGLEQFGLVQQPGHINSRPAGTGGRSASTACRMMCRS